jgi:hypothetical protein
MADNNATTNQQREQQWQAVVVVVMATETAAAMTATTAAAAAAKTSEVQSKMLIMGHQISSCHVPVVRSFFILQKMLLSSLNLPYDHLPKY